MEGKAPERGEPICKPDEPPRIFSEQSSAIEENIGSKTKFKSKKSPPTNEQADTKRYNYIAVWLISHQCKNQY